MILHHYSISPYSEKIRLMLGYAGISWQSSIVPPMPPRPTLDPMLGGYRRIPVAQIGADIFCDTQLIVAEIARIAEKPELSFSGASEQEANFANHVNDTVFMPVVQGASPSKVLKKLLFQYWPWQIAGFLKDRAMVGKTSTLPKLKTAEKETIIEKFKADLETYLTDSDFLFGDSPTIADFAAYHLVWLAGETRHEHFLDTRSKAAHWENRMKRFGHARHTRINKMQLFETAAKSKPRSLEETSSANNHRDGTVIIQPIDYAQDATSGKLVGESDERWIIARETNEFGLLHIHFPKKGYDLKVA